MDEQEYTELDVLYRARVAAHDQQVPGYQAAWETFAERTLAAGGRLLVPPLVPEEDLAQLTTRLRHWPGDQATLRCGHPNRCHSNSAELWLAEEVEQLATGYALSGDGLWRQHTWAVAADGTIVETTVLRSTYAGIVLDDAEAVLFAVANVTEETFAAALHTDGRAAHLTRAALVGRTRRGR